MALKTYIIRLKANSIIATALILMSDMHYESDIQQSGTYSIFSQGI